MTTATNVRLKLLGHAELSVDGAPGKALPKKAFAIAARLILSTTERKATRDDLATFLWPEAAEDQRRANLRTVVKRIRIALREIAGAPFVIDEETISLDLGGTSCDLVDFIAAVRHGRLSDVVEATRLFTGDLLEDSETGPETFRYWLEQERKRLGRQFARAATRALKGGELLGQPRLREAIELKILSARPIDATAHKALLRLQTPRGGSRPQRSATPFAMPGWPFTAAGFASPASEDGAQAL